MNDFREFQKQYNDYLCHAQGTGSSMKYGSKEYRKSGRRVYGSEAANMRPKDYIAKCVRQGMTNEEIIKQCETALDPGYNPTTDEKHFFMEVIRLVKNDVQHSYNDFRELHEDYLMHFGILGMKWGVRRYQNPDGTLTPAGKARYDKLNAKANQQTNSRAKYKLQAKAAKYGTQTPEEKAETTKKVEEFKKKKIEETKNIDLEKIRNSFPTDETKDEWIRAVENDTYDMKFLEITQNDYDDYPEEAKRKQQLKDYGDYLNARDTAKKTLSDKDFDGEKGDEAADLALKAYKKLGYNIGDLEPGDRGSRDWAKNSDQTIGETRVADLCKTVKNKGEVINILKSLEDNRFLRDIPESKNALWELNWFYGSEIGGDYAKSHGKPGEKYIDTIFAILQAEGKLQHSAVNEIFEKFGII